MRCPYDQEMLERNTDVVMGINFLLDKSQEFSKFWTRYMWFTDKEAPSYTIIPGAELPH